MRTTSVGILLRRLERTLGLAEVKEGLAELQAELLAEGNVDLFSPVMRGSRAAHHDAFEKLADGRLDLDEFVDHVLDRPRRELQDRLLVWYYRPHLPADHARYLETMSSFLAAAQLPEPEQRRAMAAIPTPPMEIEHMLSRLLLPSRRLHDVTLRTRGELRCGAVALAVERFRLRTGRWPATLAEIPKDLLPTMPLDPFDGQPVRYVRRADGVTIYTIGPDEHDDGGSIRFPGKSSDADQDFGFRLYDPAMRGLPAAEN